jgi:hypothetical protein
MDWVFGSNTSIHPSSRHLCPKHTPQESPSAKMVALINKFGPQGNKNLACDPRLPPR